VFVRRLLIFWLLLVAGLGAGCDGANPVTLITDTQGNVREIVADDAVFQDNVKLFQENLDDQIVEINADSITFTSTVPPLEVGDVVIKGDGLSQFTRKILTIDQVNGQTIVTTGPVGFNDIFKEADIAETINLGPEFLSDLQPSIPGVSFGEPVQVLAQTTTEVAAWELPVRFDDAVVGQNGRGSIALNGTVFLRLAIKTDLKVGFGGVERFALVPKVSIAGNLKATGSGSGDFRQEFPLCPEFSYPLVGFAGIGLNLGGQLLITVDGYIQSGGDVSVSGSVVMEGGVEATNNQWRPIYTFTPEFSVSAPRFLSDATLNLSLIQPKLRVNLADMGEVYVNAQMLKLEAQARAVSSPQPGYDVRVYRNFALEAGARLAIGFEPFVYRYNGYFPIVSGDRVQVAQLGVPLPAPPASGGLVLVTILGDQTPLKIGEERLLQSFQLQFSGFIPLPTFQDLDWRSSNSAVVRVTDFGFAALLRGVGPGTAEITAKPTVGSTGFFRQQVSSSGLRSISIVDESGVRAQTLSQTLGQTSGATITVPEFRSSALKARGLYADGSSTDLTYAFNWGVANDNARAFRNGQVDGRIEGTSTLSVSDPISGRTTNAQVRIQREPISFLNIFPLSPTKAQVTTGQTLQLRSNARYSDSSVREVTKFITWSSSDLTVARVENGLVTPVDAGEVDITVSDPSGRATYSKRVVVNQAAMTGLSVTPNNLQTVLAGTSQQFTATATFADGRRKVVSDKVVWRSNTDQVGTLSATGLFTFRSAGEVRVKALYRGFTATTANFEVKGPSLMLFTGQPADVLPETPFEVAVEIRDADNELWSPPLPVTLELFGGPSNATLAGTVTRTTVNGVATFPGLTVNQIGQGYQIRALSSGLPIAESDTFAGLDSGGPDPGSIVGHLFVGDRNGLDPSLHVIGVGDNAILEPASGGETSLGDRPEGLVRLGQYVYAATTGSTAQDNVIVGYSYTQATGALAPITVFDSPSTFASFFQPVFLTSNGSDALIYLAGSERFMYSFNVDSADGSLSGNASFQVPGSGSAGDLVYYDVPANTEDRVYVSLRDVGVIHVYGFNSVQGRVFGVEGMNPSDVSPLSIVTNPVSPTPGAMATLGNNLFVANPNNSGLSHFIIDASGALTEAVPSLVATGTAPGAVYSVANFLYVANSGDSTVSAYSISGNTVTALNGGTAYPTGDANPHSFAEVSLGGNQSALYVATSNRLVGFLLDTATGLLTSVEVGTVAGLVSPGEVRH
jgi:6-phosphogluconolactonase (cycloisomerase 2 family)